MLPTVSEQEGGVESDPARWLARLPPGRHGLAREFVIQNQRGRIAAGIIASVAERGYQETTISQIAAAAGVSRRTFYGYFASKQECFLDTFDLIVEHLRAAAGEAAAEATGWPERVRARVAAALDAFAANPDLATFILIAPPRAGSELAERYSRAMDEALSDLTEGMPESLAAGQLSSAAEQALIGGVAALVVHKVEAGEGERLPELLPDLLELVLTPFLGRAEAVRIARQGA
jgi:AcrR family transcriptional regulator